MKHVHLTLGYLREQRAKLDAAIAILETLVGNGNGHPATLKAAAAALAQHEEAQPRGRPPGPPKARAYHTIEAKLARRQKSLAILEGFDRAEPRRATAGRGRALMPLIRHGYLKRKGDGYVRTVKPFVP